MSSVNRRGRGYKHCSQKRGFSIVIENEETWKHEGLLTADEALLQRSKAALIGPRVHDVDLPLPRDVLGALRVQLERHALRGPRPFELPVHDLRNEAEIKVGPAWLVVTKVDRYQS